MHSVFYNLFTCLSLSLMKYRFYIYNYIPTYAKYEIDTKCGTDDLFICCPVWVQSLVFCKTFRSIYLNGSFNFYKRLSNSQTKCNHCQSIGKKKIEYPRLKCCNLNIAQLSYISFSSVSIYVLRVFGFCETIMRVPAKCPKTTYLGFFVASEHYCLELFEN